MSRIKTEVTYEDLLPYLEYLTLSTTEGKEYDLCHISSNNTLFEYFGNCIACPFDRNTNCMLYSLSNPSLHLVIKQLQQLHPELFI